MIANAMLADVAELADALDLGSSTVRCEGSSPFVRIDNQGKCCPNVVVVERRIICPWRRILCPTKRLFVLSEEFFVIRFEADTYHAIKQAIFCC